MTSMKGRVAIVTGASSGIGKATARAFDQAGYTVIAAGRDADRLEKAISGLADTHGFLGDLSEPDTCRSLIAKAEEEFGGLDVLVNNAGIIFRATADETTDEQWRKTMSVNTDAVFYLSRAAIPALRRRGGGSIVNIASDWGIRGGRNAAAYCASKGAVVMLTKAMALDHAREGIRVNAICPGDVNTPMLTYEALQRGEDPAKAMAENAADSPNGRVTEPEEIAAFALFLASDAAPAITGAALSIDGGASA